MHNIKKVSIKQVSKKIEHQTTKQSNNRSTKTIHQHLAIQQQVKTKANKRNTRRNDNKTTNNHLIKTW